MISYRSQNYLSNQNNGIISNLGWININSGNSSSICEESCKCDNLEGDICVEEIGALILEIDFLD